jgi:DNA-binding CsgD family transcriptional regulator
MLGELNSTTIGDISNYDWISPKTVENQHNGIMKKLDLFSIAGLTKYAVREGLSSLH